jgi:hypothetical protein
MSEPTRCSRGSPSPAPATAGRAPKYQLKYLLDVGLHVPDDAAIRLADWQPVILQAFIGNE